MIDLITLKSDLRSDEGFRAFPYIDTTGNMTIGYGFNIEQGRSEGLPVGVAETWLTSNIVKLDYLLNQTFPWYIHMSSARCNVLVQLAYQLGFEGLSKFKNMLKYLAMGDYKNAAAECLDSLAAKQAPERFQRHAKALLEG